MSYTYRLHLLTKQDYDEAYEWYEDKQKGLGERYLKAVRKKIEEIVLHPEAYSSKSNKRFREARVDFFPYLIVYKVSKRKKENTSVLFTTQKNILIKSTEKNNYNSNRCCVFCSGAPRKKLISFHNIYLHLGRECE